MIIAGGRTLLRPIYRRIADMGNADVFAALTLLVVLGTSVLTQIAGLSLALGAFLVRARSSNDGFSRRLAGYGCPLLWRGGLVVYCPLYWLVTQLILMSLMVPECRSL